MRSTRRIEARRDAASWTRALQRAQEQVERAQEGVAKALAKGEWLGRIRAYDELLHLAPRPDAELAAMSVEQLRELAELLRGEMVQGQRPLSGPSAPS